MNNVHCDECGKPYSKNWRVRQLIVNNRKWEEICQKSKVVPYSPKNTFLCPECIEKLNGKPLTLEDLTQDDGRTYPMNYWYFKKYKINAFLPILHHVRKCSRLFGIEQAIGLWKRQKELV